MFLSKLKTVMSTFLVAALLATTMALSLARGQTEPRQPAATSADIPAQAKTAAKADGIRKVLEAIDWTVTDVDEPKGTISVDDHSTFTTTGNPKVTLITTPTGVAASGLALNNLSVTAATKITLDGKEAKLKDLKPGMRARLRMDADRAGLAKIEATSMRPPVFRYVLKAVDSDAQTISATLTEKELDMEKLPVAKDAQIQFVEARVGARLVDAKLADLQPGMHVALELMAEKDRLVVRRILATK